MRIVQRSGFVADWEQRLRFSLLKTLKLIAVAALLALGSASVRPATPDIYPDPTQARADLAAALKTAAATHKRILLDFGGNWCGDCQVLDIYFHNPANRPILEANFVLVHINIGMKDANLALAKRYGVPIDKGVPALAVLSDNGTLLYSQKTGQFAPMRTMEPSSVTHFLVQWKPVRRGCSLMVVNC